VRDIGKILGERLYGALDRRDPVRRAFDRGYPVSQAFERRHAVRQCIKVGALDT